MSANQKFRYGGRVFAQAVRVLLPVAVVLATAGAIAAPAAAAPNTADPFYTPPADYEAAQPGTILRTRSIEPSFSQLIPMRVDAWQLLYRTTDAGGRPYAAVTTVLKPVDMARPTALLSYQNMTDAVAPHCQPSQTLQQGKVPWFDLSSSSPIQLSTMANETPMVAAALARGWAVSVPDHGGVDNNSGGYREPGYVVLDGIRAATAFDSLSLDPDTRTVLWGYSGGGMASSWAAREQPSYAPELNLVGAALGAPVADTRAALLATNGTPVGGAFVLLGLIGMVQDSPEFAAALNRYLTPAGRQKITEAMANCAPQNMASFLGFDANQFLTAPLEHVLADPIIGAALTARNLDAPAPTAPLYVYNAIDDEGSTIAAVDAFVENHCATGTSVTYRRSQLSMPLSGHTGEWFLGAPAALAWLQQQVEDPSPQTGCDTRTIPTTAVEPEALEALTSGILTGSIRALLGF